MSNRRDAPGTAVQADLFGHLPLSARESTPRTTATEAAASSFLRVGDSAGTLDVRIERSGRGPRVAIRVDVMTQAVVAVVSRTMPLETVERLVRGRLDWIRAALRGQSTGHSTDLVDIEHAGETLTIAYEPSRRARRVALRVDARSGQVKLVVPPRMSQVQALDFARRHAGWIAARLKRRHPPQPFADGSVLPIFGRPHRIRHRPEARGVAWVEDGELHIAGGAEHVPRRVGDWLAAQLRATLAPLVREKAARVDRRVGHITLRDTASQWGSCASSGDLCFSLRLVFAPPEVVDYVVAHEIAHLVHHNHSPRFWALTQSLTGADVAASKAWLRRHGPGLMRYG
ncbi:MAG TPA: SprT family zinc-dependent metalloprotease [Vineibacter sp.]|nr:SprT family zinc-dependent metalloprotease [Vineibacter sp.]